MSSTTSIQSLIPVRADDTPAQKHQKIENAAQQFEAILINTLCKSLQEGGGLMGGDDDSDAGGGTLQDLGLQAFSTALASTGGLGMGKMMVHSLERSPEAGQAQGEDGNLLIR